MSTAGRENAKAPGSRGRRGRRGRRAVLDALAQAARPADAATVWRLAIEAGREISIATVYRTLRQLELDGTVTTSSGPDVRMTFALSPDAGPDEAFSVEEEPALPGAPQSTTLLDTYVPSPRHADVLVALTTDGRFRSARQLHASMSRTRPIGLATVHRALRALADNGDVDTVRGQFGESLFRTCAPQPHHHLVCRSCGRAEELPDAAVTTLFAAWADRRGFTQVDAEIALRGVCAACATA